MTEDEMIAVLKAHKEGKEIECLQWNGKWSVVEPTWDFSHCEYRVKPEHEYTPFSDMIEMMEAMRTYGEWIEIDDKMWKIVGVDDEGINTIKGYYTYKDLLKTGKFLGGNPIGKKC